MANESTTTARVIGDLAIEGALVLPGATVTKEQCGASWDKWLSKGAIELVKDKDKEKEEKAPPTSTKKAEA